MVGHEHRLAGFIQDVEEGGVDGRRFDQRLPVEDGFDCITRRGGPGGHQNATQADHPAEAVVQQRPGHVHGHIVEPVDVVDVKFAQRLGRAERLPGGIQRLQQEGVAPGGNRRGDGQAVLLLHRLAHAPIAGVEAAEGDGGHGDVRAAVERPQRPRQLQPVRQCARRIVPEQIEGQITAGQCRRGQLAMPQQPQRPIGPARSVGHRNLHPRGGDDALRPGHVHFARRPDDADRFIAHPRRQLAGCVAVHQRELHHIASRRHGRRQFQGVAHRARLIALPIGRVEGDLVEQVGLGR